MDTPLPEDGPDRSVAADLSVSSIFSDIYRGLAISASASGGCTADSAGAVRLLWLKHIDRDGTIAEPDENTVWRSDIPDRNRLRAGDLLLSEIVSGRPKAAVVREQDLPAAAVGSILVLRPASVLSPEHTRLILAFLRSSAVASRARGGFGRMRVSKSDLVSLILPEADEALSAALDELETARNQMIGWGTEAASLAESVFDGGANTAVARQSIIEIGQLTRLRAEAAAQLDDFGYIVRTRFPYPVALRWREAEARESTDDLARAYASVLEAGEILLCYSALLAAALAHSESIELSSVAGLRAKLAGNRGGPGLGEWTAVLQEIAGTKKRRSLSQDHPLHELGSLLSDDAARSARKRIAGRRNAEAHLRPVDPVDLPVALRETFDDLRILADRARFLADWSLIQVTSVDWDAFQGRATLSFRRLAGDHPVVPTSTMSYSSSEVEKGSLYLVDRDHRLYLLRPFLTGQVCPVCRTWSTFHVDLVDGELVLKSLEHGHCLPHSADVGALQQAGLL
ncbi:restriction endonuclease [Streptomyces rochei]|uniref:restriction endonuclease n=1 Tax=Streptomyces TaxID=1883 RepID=UPI001C23B1A3|nr:restriction endonuclease [Streptomyces sp. Babs14]MBU8558711.1 restriction endonuclease [Streptomyces sp. Babs14]